MKTFLMMVGVADNEYPEGGVLLECPKNHPAKNEVPFILITPRSNGLAVEGVTDLRLIDIREKEIIEKEVPNSMWEFVYKHCKKFSVVVVPAFEFYIEPIEFDLELVFHALGGFSQADRAFFNTPQKVQNEPKKLKA